MIKVSNVTLTYDLYHDQTRSLKEAVINFFIGGLLQRKKRLNLTPFIIFPLKFTKANELASLAEMVQGRVLF